MAPTGTPAGGGTVKYSWNGDYPYLLWNLIMKDFKVRYRNMSLGVFWSLLNPLVMLGILWFVFTNIFTNVYIKNFPVYFLSGLVSLNLFTLCGLTGTLALVDSSQLVKRQMVPREIIPISGVLSQGLHVVIQMLLLLGFVVGSGTGVNIYWLLLPVLWGIGIVFVSGFALVFSAVNVYVRDTRYIVESLCTLMFWLVPIVYPFSFVPEHLRGLFLLNPITALAVASRSILIDATLPDAEVVVKLVLVSAGFFVTGLFVFRGLRARFYDYL